MVHLANWHKPTSFHLLRMATALMIDFATGTTSTKKRNEAKTKAQTNPARRIICQMTFIELVYVANAFVSIFWFMLNISPGTTWQQMWWSTITSNWQTLSTQKGNKWSLSFPQKWFLTLFSPAFSAKHPTCWDRCRSILKLSMRGR